MATSPPDDVVLVARSNEECVQLAVDLRAYIEGLALEGGGPIEYKLLGGKKRDERDVQMVLVSELPVHYPAEGGVRAKAEILMKINRDGIGVALDGSRRL